MSFRSASKNEWNNASSWSKQAKGNFNFKGITRNFVKDTTQSKLIKMTSSTLN